MFTALAVVECDIELRSGKQVKLSRAYINARNLQYSAYSLIKEGAEVSSLGSIADNDIGEGGHFDYALHFINRYGVVPERVMRDFKDSADSATLIADRERSAGPHRPHHRIRLHRQDRTAREVRPEFTDARRKRVEDPARPRPRACPSHAPRPQR